MPTPAALETALAQPAALLHWLVQVGESWLWCEWDYASAGSGHYVGRILAISPWEYGIPRKGYGLQTPQVTIRVTDTDGFWRDVLEGSTGIVRGSVVTIKVAEATVAAASWQTVFTGRLDSWRMTAAYEWELSATQQDQPLLGTFPRGGWVIGRADWPNAAPEVIGLPAPIIAGNRSSVGTSATGSVECLRTDTALFRYLVCAGHAKSVDNVYVDGAIQSSGYSISKTTINGRAYTLIVFTADPGASASVTADVQGIEATGDGTGALVTDPVAQLTIILDSFVYGDWQSGAWDTGVAPIDSTSWAAATSFLAALANGGYQGSQRIGELMTGVDLINAWCESCGIWCSWSEAGTLVLLYEDHRPTSDGATTYLTTPWLTEDDLGDVAVEYDASTITDRVTVRYLPSASGYMAALDVEERATSEVATSEVSMSWARGNAL